MLTDTYPTLYTPHSPLSLLLLQRSIISLRGTNVREHDNVELVPFGNLTVSVETPL